MIRHFVVPTALSVAALVAVYLFFGTTAFLTAILLSVLEVTLSFDNAVVNAKVLKNMSPVWQRRFLTWGMVVAVVGTRLILPIAIVSVSSWSSPLLVATLALLDPASYAKLLAHTGHAIHAFGGAFLLMVSLKYFIDENKTVHWIHAIEKKLSEWARIEALEIGAGLIVITAVALGLPHEEQSAVLIAGSIGIVLFILMEGVTKMFSSGMSGRTAAAAAGLSLFIYLNVLDTAFSLDSVVGAFAITNLIPVILAGLGIGAYFVRSITLFLVEKDALSSLKYLEHGAHWAIFGLAASMFVSLLIEVPEVVTGSIGLVFVLLAYYSSIVARNLKRAA